MTSTTTTTPTAPARHLSLAGLTIALDGRPFRLQYVPAHGDPERPADLRLDTVAVLSMEHEDGNHRIEYELTEAQLTLDAFKFKSEVGDVVTGLLDQSAYPQRLGNKTEAMRKYGEELTGVKL